VQLDVGGVDDVPDRLAVTVEVERELDEVEPVVTDARTLPVDDGAECLPARRVRSPA